MWFTANESMGRRTVDKMIEMSGGKVTPLLSNSDKKRDILSFVCLSRFSNVLKKSLYLLIFFCLSFESIGFSSLSLFSDALFSSLNVKILYRFQMELWKSCIFLFLNFCIQSEGIVRTSYGNWNIPKIGDR